MTGDPAVGVIGQGTMGGHFRDQFLAAGFETRAFDVDDDSLAAAVEAGATPAESAADLTRSVDVVVVSVPGNLALEAVMEGEAGVLEAVDAGQVVVDASTVRPDVDAEYARQCDRRGADYLDAPVTWTGPQDGVSCFVGGDSDTYAELSPVFDAFADRHGHYGPVGTGQVAKAGQRVQQLFYKLFHTEVVEFVRNNGVDPEQLSEQLDWGLGEGFFHQTLPDAEGLSAAVADRADDDPVVPLQDSGVRYHLRDGRDIQYALDIAHASRTAVPLLATANEVRKSNRRYREVLRRQSVDYEWGERTGTAHWRRANRPEESWLSLLEE